MPNEVLVKQGTSITWDSAGTDFGISLESLADGGGAEGAKGDLGATRAARYHVFFVIEFSSAPTAGGGVELYWAASTNATAATDNPGGADGTDSSYAPGGGADADRDEFKRQLTHIGTLIVTADAAVQRQGFEFAPPTRYGMPVVMNECGTSTSATTTNFKIVFTPITDEIQ